MVRFARQITATRGIRSGRSRATRQGPPVGGGITAASVTRRISQRNCVGCKPVNGWINSERETENICTNR